MVQQQRTPWLRSFVDETLSADDIRDIALEHFKRVHERFTDQMNRGQLIRELVDFCSRQHQDKELIALVEERNPVGAREFHRRRGLAATARYPDLGERLNQLLERGDASGIVDETSLLRGALLTVRRHLDDDAAWAAMGPVNRPGAPDPEQVRDTLVSRTIRVLSAADYLLEVAKPEGRRDLGSLGESGPERTDLQLRRMYDARSNLADELRGLWRDLCSQLIL